jgi:sugar lactone lactonase YvrE
MIAKFTLCLLVSWSFIGRTSSLQAQPGPGYWQLRQEASESLEKHDYRSALERLLEADRRLPGNPDTILNLAEVECHLGQCETGMQQLQRLVRMRVYFDLTKEPAFAELGKSVQFQNVLSEMEKMRTVKIVRAKPAFRVADPSFLPEGIAHDSKTGDLFLSSMYHRKIVRFTPKGQHVDFVPAGQNDIWSISGIGVDSIRRTLWACSNRFEGGEGYKAGMPKGAMPYAFDLDTAHLQRQYPIQEPGDDHFCDGLTLSPDGTVFVADSAGLAIYQLSHRDERLRVLVGPEIGISPQGLALSRDGRILFVSNYLSGLYAINLAGGGISPVREDPPDSLAGIDGLISHGQDLIAIQNGIQPNRVVMLKMSADGLTVEAVKTLDINHPLFGEPTLGVVVNDSLFFVANNPVERFLSDHKFEGFPGPVVLRRDLN